MAITKVDQLASDVERALAEYMGVPTFETEKFPALARAFARVVDTSEVNAGMVSPWQVTEKAKSLVANLGDFHTALSELVE